MAMLRHALLLALCLTLAACVGATEPPRADEGLPPPPQAEATAARRFEDVVVPRLAGSCTAVEVQAARQMNRLNAEALARFDTPDSARLMALDAQLTPRCRARLRQVQVAAA